MIIREATAADLRPLLRLCKKEWARLGVTYTLDLDRLRRCHEQGRYHIIVVYDKKLAAVLIGHQLETDRGPGNIVDILIVDQRRPDRMALVDAVSLYACNIAASEGRRIIVSQWKVSTFCIEGVRYGRDVLDFDIDAQGDGVHQVGDVQAVIANILRRNPEWQLSPTPTT